MLEIKIEKKLTLVTFEHTFMSMNLIAVKDFQFREQEKINYGELQHLHNPVFHQNLPIKV